MYCISSSFYILVVQLLANLGKFYLQGGEDLLKDMKLNPQHVFDIVYLISAVLPPPGVCV